MEGHGEEGIDAKRDEDATKGICGTSPERKAEGYSKSKTKRASFIGQPQDFVVWMIRPRQRQRKHPMFGVERERRIECAEAVTLQR